MLGFVLVVMIIGGFVVVGEDVFVLCVLLIVFV